MHTTTYKDNVENIVEEPIESKFGLIITAAKINR